MLSPPHTIVLLFLDSILDLISDILNLVLGSLHVLLQVHLLLAAPVVVRQVSVSLRELRTLVDKVAAKQEEVSGRDGEGVAHECRGVDDQGTGHLTGDAAEEASVKKKQRTATICFRA